MRRSLPEIISALQTAEDELRFHATRLSENPVESEDEREHVADIEKLYRESARGCAVLRRYQEGRVRKQGVPALDGDVHATTSG